MTIPSVRRVLVLLVAILATAGMAAAQAPKPGPEAIDAWGRTIDVDAKVREQLAAKVTAKMGSPEWVPVAFRVLEIQGGILPRMYWAAGLELECGKLYRRQQPEKTAEQYATFLASAEGQAFETKCVVAKLSEPAVDPRLADGMVASIEVGFMLPQILQTLQQRRVQEGLAGAPPAVPPGMENELPELVAGAFTKSSCLLKTALADLPIAKALAEPAKFQAAITAAMKSGPCGFSQTEAAGG